MILQPATPRRLSARSGLTLIEVMIAVAILAIGLFAVLSTQVNLNLFRRHLDEQTAATLVLQQVVTRMLTLPQQQLGGLATGAPAWAKPRLAAPDPPLQYWRQAGTFVDVADLATAGVIASRATGLREPQVYIEYYTPGINDKMNELLDSSVDAMASWQQLVGNPALGSPATITDYALTSPFSATDQNDPKFPEMQYGLVIRVLIAWQPLEIATLTAQSRQWKEITVTRGF